VVSLREAAAASAATASTRGEECEALRAALAAVEGRLVEYQQKDVEVRVGGVGSWGSSWVPARGEEWAAGGSITAVR
jgi:hypothetical protein